MNLWFYRAPLRGIAFSVLSLFTIHHAAAQSMHQCAQQNDQVCIDRRLAEGAAVDELDNHGRTALFQTAESIVVSRSSELASRAVDTLLYLCAMGASWDMGLVRTLLHLHNNKPAARRALDALNNPANQSRWQAAAQDERFRLELDLTRENFLRAKAHVDQLHRSGRFVDLYIAYAVTRDTKFAKAAQMIAQTKSERVALEHMAILTLPDPGELLSASFDGDSNSLPHREYGGHDYFLLNDLNNGGQLSGWLRLRPAAKSRIPLIHGNYRVQTDIQLVAAPLSKTDIPDWDRSFLLHLPIFVDIRPATYTGAAIVEFEQLRSAIEDLASGLGGSVALSRKIKPIVRKFERLR